MPVTVDTSYDKELKPGRIVYPHVNTLTGPLVSIHDEMLNTDALEILQTCQVPKETRDADALVYIPLASDFGHLHPNDIDKMTDTALISTVIAKKSLEVNLRDKFFSGVVICLKNAFFIEVDNGVGTKITNATYELANKDLGESDYTITEDDTNKIKGFLRKNIPDSKAYESLEFDKFAGHLAELVHRKRKLGSGETILPTLSADLKMLTAGLILFPDVERPYFTCYECSLNAYFRREFEIARQNATNEYHGIRVSFTQSTLKLPDTIANGLHNRPLFIEAGKKFLRNESKKNDY